MAIDSKSIELINAGIDGEIGDDGRAELERLLAEDAEARDLHEELTALAGQLNGLPELDPPAHLRHLLRESRPKARRQAAPQPAPGLLERITGSRVFGYAATFAAGVIMTLAIVDSGQISERAFDDVTPLVGTIAKNEEAFEVPVHSTISVNETAVAGTVTLRSTGPIMIVDFDLSTREPVEVIAGYSDRTIWFNGFAQLESSGTSVAAQPGSVRLTLDGKRRYAVYLQNPGKRPTKIDLTFQVDGEIVYETALEYRAIVE